MEENGHRLRNHIALRAILAGISTNTDNCTCSLLGVPRNVATKNIYKKRPAAKANRSFSYQYYYVNRLKAQELTFCLASTERMAATILSPFSFICAGVHERLILEETHLDMTPSLTLKSLLACFITVALYSG